MWPRTNRPPDWSPSYLSYTAPGRAAAAQVFTAVWSGLQTARAIPARRRRLEITPGHRGCRRADDTRRFGRRRRRAEDCAVRQSLLSIGRLVTGLRGRMPRWRSARPVGAADEVSKAHASVALPLSVRPCGSRPNGVPSTELAVINVGWRSGLAAGAVVVARSSSSCACPIRVIPYPWNELLARKRRCSRSLASGVVI